MEGANNLGPFYVLWQSDLLPTSPGSSSPSMDQLTNTERLLLSQAVYQEGANDWFKVSQIISNHPLIGRPKSYFNPTVRTLSSCRNHAAIMRMCSDM